MGGSESKAAEHPLEKKGSMKEEDRKKQETEEQQQEMEEIDKKGVEDEEEKEKKRQQSSEEEGAQLDSDDEDIPDALRPDLQRQGSKELQYAWEQKIIDETLMKNSPIEKAAIVGLDGVLKAWSPPDFTPDNQVIQDIIAGFEGDVSGLAERGLAVGCGAKLAVPAKMDEKAIFGNDGQGGGTSVFKTTQNLVIIVFTKRPAITHRLAIRTATFMRNYQR